MARRTDVQILCQAVASRDNNRGSVRAVAIDLGWTEEKVRRVMERCADDLSIPLYYGKGGTLVFRGSERGASVGIYADVSRVIQHYWGDRRGLRDIEVHETARSGRRGDGIWSHPDLVVMANPRRRRHRDDPKDLYSIEVETDAGFDIRSVYQAHSQGRGATFSWVFFAAAGKTLGVSDRISWAADELGVGLVEFGKAGSYGTWKVLREADRRVIDREDRENFLRNTGLDWAE